MQNLAQKQLRTKTVIKCLQIGFPREKREMSAKMQMPARLKMNLGTACGGEVSFAATEFFPMGQFAKSGAFCEVKVTKSRQLKSKQKG